MRGFAWESRTKGTRIVDLDYLKRLFKSYLFGTSNLNKYVLIDWPYLTRWQKKAAARFWITAERSGDRNAHCLSC